MFVVYQSSPSEQDSAERQEQVEQYGSSSDGAGTDAERYDDGITAGQEQVYTYVNGSDIKGSYSKDDYDLSVDISNELAKKYSDSFEFYYIIADDGDESGEFYMTSESSNDKAFKVSVNDSGVSDNLYSSKYLTANDTQMWADDYGESFPNLQGIVRSNPDMLLGSGGLNMGSMNDIQVRTAPDIVILVSGKYKGGSKAVEDMTLGILEDSGVRDSYAGEFDVSVVELTNEDGVYEHIYEAQDVTPSNYKDKLSVGKVHTYSIAKDGKVE